MSDHESKISQMAAALRGDGCSMVPDFSFRHCCDEHDIAYRTGKSWCGEEITRSQADAALRRCIRRNGATWFGRNILSWVFWIGVRIGGRKAWGDKDGVN